jgi:diguanylate cyclase (GGDEF)-like protein
MKWKLRWRWLLGAYRSFPALVRRKAEIAALVSLLLAGLFLANLAIGLAVAGPSWALGIRTLVVVTALGAGVLFLVRGRLEVHVNILLVLSLGECLALFFEPLTRSFFSFSLFSMIAFAILAVRTYQRLLPGLVFPGLVLAKGLVELAKVSAGDSQAGLLQQTIFTLLVFAAAIPLVQFLMVLVGREIRHKEVLLGANQALQKEVVTDQLTGTWNRRHFDQLVRKVTGDAQRTGKPLALGILDLDRFKQVNDQWGHGAGDEALALVVKDILGVLRQGDTLVRWGGDEFVVLCPGVGHGDTFALGDKILGAVRADPKLAGWNLGVSIGVAVWRPGEPLVDVLARADRLLYQAKESGRNRVCFEDGSTEGSCSGWGGT